MSLFVIDPYVSFPVVGGAAPDFVLGGFRNSFGLTADVWVGLTMGLFPPGSADSEAPIIENSTLKNYTCHVATNTSSGSADELRSYISGSDGNGAISIAVATTGVFQDTSNTDSVSQGDDFAFHFVEGTTANVIFSSLGFEVAA